MQKCLELSKLAKPSTGPRSIQFKHATPGNIHYVAYAMRPPPKDRAIDPLHPALSYQPKLYMKTFPWMTFPGFKLRVVPKGILDDIPVPFPDPPFKRPPVYRKEARHENSRVSMSLMDVAAKGLGGRVLRVKVLQKIKTAISLVVTRGADVEQGADGTRKIVFREEDAGRSWVLSDWTYMIKPDVEVNSMSYAEIIPTIRAALGRIANRGLNLEDSWAKQGRRMVPTDSSEDLDTLTSRKTQLQRNVAMGHPGAQQPLNEFTKWVDAPLHDVAARRLFEALRVAKEEEEHQDSAGEQSYSKKIPIPEASVKGTRGTPKTARRPRTDVDASHRHLRHDNTKTVSHRSTRNAPSHFTDNHQRPFLLSQDTAGSHSSLYTKSAEKYLRRPGAKSSKEHSPHFPNAMNPASRDP